ncbi:MAG TPA: winged helix-turn-helix domain-containing protein [Blastocatellia bacterium]
MQLREDQDYIFGRFHLDSRERILLDDGKVVPITLKAFDILFVLVQRSGHIVEKGELMKQVWPNAFVEEANITQHVYKLRRVLGVSPDGRQYIETVPRRGYRFIGAIRERRDQHFSLVMRRRNDETEKTANAAIQTGLVTSSISLAILPFANEGVDPDAEYLSDGITESLISTLSELPHLRIMSRRTVFQYRDREIDPLQIGRDLNVRAVVTGRVLQVGDALIIKIEMVDAVDGSYLWHGQYNRRIQDVFKVQEAISRTISDKLQIRIKEEMRSGILERNQNSSTISLLEQPADSPVESRAGV